MGLRSTPVLCVFYGLALGCGDSSPIEPNPDGTGTTEVGTSSGGADTSTTGLPDTGSESAGETDPMPPDMGTQWATCADAIRLHPGETYDSPPGTSMESLHPCGDGDSRLAFVRYFVAEIPASTNLVVKGSASAQLQVLDQCDGTCLTPSATTLHHCGLEEFGSCILVESTGDEPREVIIAAGRAEPPPEIPIEPVDAALSIGIELHPALSCWKSPHHGDACGDVLSVFDSVGTLPGCDARDPGFDHGVQYLLLLVPDGQYAYVRTPGEGCPGDWGGPQHPADARVRLTEECVSSCLTPTADHVRWVNDTGADAMVSLVSGPNAIDGLEYHVQAVVRGLSTHGTCETAEPVVDGASTAVHVGEGSQALPSCAGSDPMEYPVFFQITVPPNQQLRVETAGAVAVRFLDSCADAAAGQCSSHEEGMVAFYENTTPAPVDLLVAIEGDRDQDMVSFQLLP